jgi:hypothetical protein
MILLQHLLFYLYLKKAFLTSYSLKKIFHLLIFIFFCNNMYAKILPLFHRFENSIKLTFLNILGLHLLLTHQQVKVFVNFYYKMQLGG